MNGPVILSLYILSGACVYGAAIHIFGAIRRPFAASHLLFSCICTALAIFGVTHVLAYQAATAPEYVAALRWNIAAVIVLFMLFPWSIADYSGVRARWFLVGSTAVFAVLFLVNLGQPHTIQFTQPPVIGTIELPWSETLSRATGPTGSLFLIGAGLVLANLVFGIYALARAWLRGRRWTGMAMLVAVALSLALSIEGILVRADVLDFVHLGPFGFALMVLILSLALHEETHGEVQDSERRFRFLVEQCPFSIQVLAPDGLALDANAAWEKLWQTPRESVRHYNVLRDPQLAEKGVLPYLERAFGGRPTEIPPILYDPAENPHVKGTARKRWVRAYAYPIKDDNGELVEVILMHEDVTERKRMEDAIRLIAAGVGAETGEAFYGKLVTSLARLFEARYAFIGLLERKDRERIRTLAVCSDGEIGTNFTYDLSGTPCENVTGQKTCAHPGGVQSEFPEDELLVRMGAESYVGTPLFDSHGGPLGLIAVIDDKPLAKVDQVKEILEIFAARASAEVQRLNAEAHIRRMAYEDYLTGLASRASLHERLSDQLGRLRVEGKAGALILIDLDHFKTINDALGHDVGDEVLRAVARRIREVVSEAAFLARVGGDEFVALLSDSFEGTARAEERGLELAAKIISKLNSPVFVGERAFSVGASIGVTAFPRESQSGLDIMRHADMALYHAKSLGRGRVQVYRPSLQAAATNRLRLEEGLRAAIANAELELYFQPQVDSRGELVGAEALLRWHHPELGEVSPEVFIPVAEETGLIHEIGDWVIERACTRLKAWLAEGVAFKGRLSFNASTWQFTSPEFLSGIERILEAQQVDANHLVLELTESALLYDIDETIEKLNRLRGLGFKIALDDFGTGYSSLAYLRDLPLDQLKIDKAFVSELRTDVEQPLVESMISIGRHMSLTVIAEGVETEVQHQRLVGMGCRIFQGYHFSHPLPEKGFLAWIDRNRGTLEKESAT